MLPNETVILSRTASVGFSAILGVDMATTQDFVNWVCGPSLKPQYLLYVFRSMDSEFRRLTMGSTHQTIYMPDFGRFSTPVPPIREQDQIVAFIQKEAAVIDTLIAKIHRAIRHLKEFRTALDLRGGYRQDRRAGGSGSMSFEPRFPVANSIMADRTWSERVRGVSGSGDTFRGLDRPDRSGTAGSSRRTIRLP